MARTKIKGYTRSDGVKVKAHVRTSKKARAIRAAGRVAKRELQDLIRNTRRKNKRVRRRK